MDKKIDSSSHEQAVQKLGGLIKDIKIAMMTTTSEDGQLFSRPMATQQAEFDGDLWFFTNDNGPKAEELIHNRHVNLSYSDKDSHRFVSVSGTAILLHDHEKAEELWNPFYRAWFPKGLEDPHLALIKVHVKSAEYWDSPSSPVVHIIGLAKAMVTGRSYEPGENKIIDFDKAI